MQIIFSSLSEMGKTMFLDLFPVEFLPEEIPRSTFFILMLQYADLDDQVCTLIQYATVSTTYISNQEPNTRSAESAPGNA